MQNSRVQIRPARRFEAVAVKRVNDECGLGRWPASDYVAATCLGDFGLEVALFDQKLVGFYLARVVGPDLELLKIAVVGAARRRGVAAALLEACLEWGRRAVCETCFLEVRQGNEAAIRLYEKYGFREIGIRRAYYRDPVEDALVMSCDLRVQRVGAGES